MICVALAGESQMQASVQVGSGSYTETHREADAGGLE
jgi:hypothetical protein